MFSNQITEFFDNCVVVRTDVLTVVAHQYLCAGTTVHCNQALSIFYMDPTTNINYTYAISASTFEFDVVGSGFSVAHFDRFLYLQTPGIDATQLMIESQVWYGDTFYLNFVLSLKYSVFSYRNNTCDNGYGIPKSTDPVFKDGTVSSISASDADTYAGQCYGGPISGSFSVPTNVTSPSIDASVVKIGSLFSNDTIVVADPYDSGTFFAFHLHV